MTQNPSLLPKAPPSAVTATPSDGPVAPHPPKNKAVGFNAQTLRKLQAAVEKDSEVDLMTQFPPGYSKRLVGFQEAFREASKKFIENPAPSKPKKPEIRDRLQAEDPVEVVYPLSPTVLALLNNTSEGAADQLSRQVVDLLHASEVLSEPVLADTMMVLKCSPDVVVKVKEVRWATDDTEYTTLQYLESYKPDIPAPRALGYVRLSGTALIFQTYMPSTTLETVWSQMDIDQKASIRDQLGTIMTELRSIPYAPGSALGGVGGEGCKDIRRHLRKSDTPIRSFAEFEEFMFTSPIPGGDVFKNLLRQLCPPQAEEMKIVFTHGDLRPDNIIVDQNDGKWIITALIDWEYSGFYPEYCEAFKCTNCLSPYGKNDWYLYLPDCISPKRYAHWWLLDRVREALVL